MSEQVGKGKVVSISYKLQNKEGKVLDQSKPGQPLEYLHGSNNIIPGLEKELEGLNVGDAKQVNVPAAEAYGEYKNDLLFKVPKENFPQDVELKQGMEFQAQTEEGPMVVQVKEVSDDFVVVDANHPLAGQPLSFDVKIDSVRDASEDEKTHGHVHGPGHSH
jgi:FKBP-type peptidyl-prolyl cis-trans isomerase SlyD